MKTPITGQYVASEQIAVFVVGPTRTVVPEVTETQYRSIATIVSSAYRVGFKDGQDTAFEEMSLSNRVSAHGTSEDKSE